MGSRAEPAPLARSSATRTLRQVSMVLALAATVGGGAASALDRRYVVIAAAVVLGWSQFGGL
jgi:hypothetical protein